MGRAIFDEPLATIWYIGAAFILCGIYLIIDGSISRDGDKKKAR